MGGNWKGEDS